MIEGVLIEATYHGSRIEGSLEYRSPCLKSTRKTWQSGLFLDAPVPDFTDAMQVYCLPLQATDQCM